MINLAIIGAGNWGRNLVRNFAALDGVELKYVCDRAENVRETMSALYPRAIVTDSTAMAIAGDVDAVVVAVDANLHYPVAKAALKVGKHVFIEKPLTLSVADARELVDLAASKNLKLMVGHLLEYHPAVNYVKNMIAADGIGNLLYLLCQRVNLGVVRKAENAWWSLAPHDISVACYLFDAEPISVSATGHACLREGVADVVFATLEFADGRMAHLHVSWLDPHKIRKITLVGSSKMIVFDDMAAAEKIRVYDKGAVIRKTVDYAESITLRNGDILIPRIPAGEPLRAECRHFIECVAEDKTPRSDGADGLRVVKVLQAGSNSMADGGQPKAV